VALVVKQLIPLNIKAITPIRDQQAHVRSRWPQGSPWLFPGILDNPDGHKPYAHGSQNAMPRYRNRVRELSPSNRSHGVHYEPEPHMTATNGAREIRGKFR
jgi:hypothetical protein